MAPLDRISCSDSSVSTNCLSELHPRQHDEHDCNGHYCERSDQHRTLWRRINNLVWQEHDRQRSGERPNNDLYDNNPWRRLLSGDLRSFGWSHRTGRNHTNHHPTINYKFAVGLLAISFLLPAGLKAEENTAVEGGITATASPQAVSTGQATNQAVQINQGGYSKQGYSPGHFCNSSTLTITPFYLGNDVHPEYTRGQNFGIQATISIPLDGEMVRLCKDLAIRKLEKERLDYNLIRVKECAALMSIGFMFHPSSPFSVICSDVVPIARETKSSSPEDSDLTSSEPES